MRILHVSDLHFGHQNVSLLENLKLRVKSLRPDLILATGDFAHHSQIVLLKQALAYLEELGSLCSDFCDGANQPKLVAVPGNHDCGIFGIIPVSGALRAYRKVFGRVATNVFFPQDQIWIYGFNSARFGLGVSSNGKIVAKEFLAFAEEYEDLKDRFGTTFQYAFKIVALHHHVVPIRCSARSSRWLSLLNAGEFLQQMALHDIDLIVHGHEHVHAQAIFGKRVQGENRRVSVVSVGTASDQNAGADHNRFNVIDIAANGEVSIDSYEGQGALFTESPVRFTVRSLQQAENRRFEQAVAEKGYSYLQVQLYTEITLEGDAYRSVDFIELNLMDGTTERARTHQIDLPATSGYIDLPSAYQLKNLVEQSPLPFAQSDQNGSRQLVITYGLSMEPGIKLSVGYNWWAVNAMAMSRTQFRCKYAGNHFMEYTHFPVVDPIENLVWIVKFPDGFHLSQRPEPYVATIVPAGEAPRRDARLEQRLRDALDFDAKNNRLYLRVHRPLMRYCYGVRWIIPEELNHETPVFTGDTDYVVDQLVRFRETNASKTKEKLGLLLVSIAGLICAKLAEGSPLELEVGLMVFDQRRRLMITTGAIVLQNSRGVWVDRDAVFKYGEGLGGRAFKTKAPRLYSRTGQASRRLPDFYMRLDTGPKYAALLSIPLRHVKVENHVYAVLNCGSSHMASPLGKLGASGSLIPANEVKDFLEMLNQTCYKELTDIFRVSDLGFMSTTPR